MTQRIAGFSGEYRFLSNFWLVPVRWAHPEPAIPRDTEWKTSEHAYQAAKTSQLGEIRAIWEAASPGAVKHLGRRVTLREGWEREKKRVMFDIVWAKFTQHGDLREALLATGDAELAELNTWGDAFWGVVLRDDGTEAGQNWLGRILMMVRDLLAEG